MRIARYATTRAYSEWLAVNTAKKPAPVQITAKDMWAKPTGVVGLVKKPAPSLILRKR